MEAIAPAVATPASAPTPSDTQRKLERVIPAQLRVDIIVRRQFFKHEEYYVVKDPLALTYFRLQPEEAYLLTLLDGKRTLLDISHQFSRRYPNHPRSVEEIGQFINSLGASGLLNVSANRFVANARRGPTPSFLSVWATLVSSALFIKIPLVDPSMWLGDLTQAMRFLWSKWFVRATLVFFAWTAGLLLVNAGEFRTHHIDFFSTSNLLLLWACIIVIKTLHEFGHAMTCRYFGGEVHEMGVCFMMFTPCGYVDASDAWMMRHKRHKLFVTIGGVYTELIIASIAAHLWLVLPNGLGRSLAFNAMLVASVNTLIFNINPLMRFDGYYVLCDLLEIPNLRSKAILYCSYHLQRIFLGYRNRQQEQLFAEEANGRVFVMYAIFAYIYMLFLIYSITQIFGRILEPVGLHGFGLYLGYFVEASFIALPFIKVFMDAINPSAHIVKTGSAKRRLVVFAGGLIALVAVSFVIPSHHHISEQAVIMPATFEGVSSEVGGVVRRVHVRTGQKVAPGDILVTLENPEVVAELATADVARRQAGVRFGALRYAGNWKTNETHVHAAQEMEVAEAGYERAAARAAKLELKASIAGYILTPDVEKLTGSYATPFAPVLRIGDVSRLRLLIPLNEDEAQLVTAGSPVSGRWAATRDAFETKLSVVSSQPAKPEDYFEGMGSYFGGAVPMQLLQNGYRERDKYPFFLATAFLERPEHTIIEGLRARVTIEGHATTVGRKAWRWFVSLFDLKAPSRGPA